MAIYNNIQALNEAMKMAMRKNENIVVYGEDAGFEGGVFRATAGIQKEFGEQRCFDAPIAEAVMVGVAVGMAINGLKPIVELQFSGFSYPAFQQIMTQVARMRNRSRGRFTCPMVIRLPMGGGINALEHHSEALEALFSHIPGLKVVLPSTPYDTKGLMLAALAANDPILFMEPKKIYRAFKQEVPDEYYEVEIGKAYKVQEGSDVTLVTYGAQVRDCENTIATLTQQNANISVELIDLRTIKPIDEEMIITSVKKTGRLIVAHEAVKSYSVASEIVTLVTEKCFEYLKTPPIRVTNYDITVPLANGEKYGLVTEAKIIDAIKNSMNFKY